MAAPPTWIPPGVVGWPPNGLSGGMHTRLLGFVKTALLRQLVPSNALVCDLFCGRGLDTERWAEAEIGRYIGVDLSASALEEAQEQWEQRDRPFPAVFCELDPCMVDLEAHLQDKGLPADIVSCMAHLQDSFTSEEMVKRLLKNVEAVLKPGGFFFGTVPDSSTIWYSTRQSSPLNHASGFSRDAMYLDSVLVYIRSHEKHECRYKYQKAVQDAMKAGSLRVNGTLPAVRTDIYKITFDDDRFLPFGSKYHMRFTDDGLPPQPQLLVHFPSLIKLAKEVGLECVEIQNLMEFYEDYSLNSGPFADVLRSCCGSLVDLKGVPVMDSKGRLTAPAIDVLSLYTTFIFKKGDSAVRTILEPAFKTSNSAAKYLTNFPCQHAENFSYSVDEEVGRKEQDPVKSEENCSLTVNGTTPNNIGNGELQKDSHQQNSETHVEGLVGDLPASRPHLETSQEKEEEVSEVMHEASPRQDINQNTGVLDNHTDGPLQGLNDEDPTKRQSSGPSKSASQTDRSLDEGHPAEEQLHDHLFGDTHPRSWPSNEAPASGARPVSSQEREKTLPRPSATSGHRSSRRVSASGASPSTELGQVHSMDIERVEKPPAADQSSNHCQGRNDKLDESSKVGRHQEPSMPDHSPQCSPRGTSERMDESSRGEEQPPLADRSPKHYMRRGHDKSTRGEDQQELAHGDHTSRHYLRRAQENRNEMKKQQDQQSTDHHSKRQQRELEGVDQGRRNKRESPQDLSSRHFERRQQDNAEDRNRNAEQQEPESVDTPSKHYTRRSSDSFNDRHKSEEAYDKGGFQGGRSKWSGRSASQQESTNRVFQSPQGGRAPRAVVKKFPASSG